MPGSLHSLYVTLRDCFGSLHGDAARRAWWPIFGADPPFEMLLGAVLVQRTRWEAVEGAILRLRDAGLLTPGALARSAEAALADRLRPVAFYTQKAVGLIAIGAYIDTHYAGDTATLLDQPTERLRVELLALPRIGAETADVIMLYAGAHPVFVVDGYTRRLFGRVVPAETNGAFGWDRAGYAVVRARIERELATDAPPDERRRLYADYHALINEQCVRYCLARPRCDGPPSRRVYSVQAGRDAYLDRESGCPLRAVCAFYRSS